MSAARPVPQVHHDRFLVTHVGLLRINDGSSGFSEKIRVFISLKTADHEWLAHYGKVMDVMFVVGPDRAFPGARPACGTDLRDALLAYDPNRSHSQGQDGQQDDQAE